MCSRGPTLLLRGSWVQHRVKGNTCLLKQVFMAITPIPLLPASVSNEISWLCSHSEYSPVMDGTSQPFIIKRYHNHIIEKFFIISFNQIHVIIVCRESICFDNTGTLQSRQRTASLRDEKAISLSEALYCIQQDINVIRTQ